MDLDWIGLGVTDYHCWQVTVVYGSERESQLFFLVL